MKYLKYPLAFAAGFILMFLAAEFSYMMHEFAAWTTQHMTRKTLMLGFGVLGGIVAMLLWEWSEPPTKL